MNHYVYRHYYKEEGQEFTIYIGKGTGERAYDFINRNDLWIKYTKSRGFPLVEILKTFSNSQEAFDFERKIRYEYYKINEAICCKDINILGENNYWHKNGLTEEMKEKLRIANVGKKYSKEINKKKGRKGKENPNYRNGEKISNEKHPKSRKCAVINNKNEVEATFTNVKFLIKYVKEKYGYSGVKSYLSSGETVNPRYSKFKDLKGYRFIYL